MFLALMNISIFYNCYFNHCYKYISIYIVHKVQILQIKGVFFQVCYKKNKSPGIILPRLLSCMDA